MTKNKIKTMQECDWCGKEAVVFWRMELLCDNCWKYIQITEKEKILHQKGSKTSKKTIREVASDSNELNTGGKGGI